MRISDWSSDVCSSDLASSCTAESWRRSSAARWKPKPRTRRSTRCRAKRPAWSPRWRSEERRVGKELSVRVDLGGRRIIQKKNKDQNISAESKHDRKRVHRHLEPLPATLSCTPT